MPTRERMPDECPYRRPFPADFDDCQAFTASEFVALDLQHRPLPSVLTCQHLSIGFGESAGSHYARCRIGDSRARADWVVQVQQAGLDALRTLSSQSRALFHPLVRRLWEAKGATLTDPHDQPAERELRAAAEAFQVVASTFYRVHSRELAAADLTPENVVELIRRIVDNFVERRSASTEMVVTDEVLSGLPSSLRVLFRPEEEAGLPGAPG